MTRLLIGMLLLLTGCSAAPPAQKIRVLWPLPPMEPRIEFVGIYRHERDMVIETEKGKLFRQLLDIDNKFTFSAPFGVAVAPDGQVLVTDSKQGNLRSFDFTRKTIKWVAPWETLQRPNDVATDSDGNIYVADGKENKIVVFSPSGEIVRKIGGKDFFANPAYLDINNQLKRIYISDSRNHRMVVFSISGEFLFNFGKPGKEPGDFAVPQGVAIDPSGDVFVADMLNARIQRFDQDGRFLATFGQQGLDYWDFEGPRDVAIGPDQNLYVVDIRKALLYCFTKEGTPLYVLGDRKHSSSPLAFITPTAIATDPQGRVYITDQLNQRLSVWQILTPDYLVQNPLDDATRARLPMLSERFKKHSGPPSGE